MRFLLVLTAGVFVFNCFPHVLFAQDSDCSNTPTSRQCWDQDFDLLTDFSRAWPDTGKTVRYDLEVTKETMAPDGHPREMLVFNKQYPGPQITADWGDNVEIVVKNSYLGNGTSIHWHGMRQLHSNHMDGANGVTECPIAPTASKTYSFKATEYGTSWYRSLYSAQHGDGLVGPIKINGPSSANYDVDLGVLLISDWFHTPIFEILTSSLRTPPKSQSILVNGTGYFNGSGTYAKIFIEPNKTNKIGIVNSGMNMHLHVAIDQHPITVIAADFVPIQPFVTSSLSISPGQRYDVIINASEASGDYWLRTGTGGGACDGPNDKILLEDTQGAIVSYLGFSGDGPEPTPFDIEVGCNDELNLVPILEATVPSPDSTPVLLDLTLNTTGGLFWEVNGVPIKVSWTSPSLMYIQNGTYLLPTSTNAITITNDQWVYITIQNSTPIPHPLHLHGHNFYVIASGLGADPGGPYNLTNPIFRDTQTVAAGGYLVIAFQADNPGAWLLESQSVFRRFSGLGVQFIERPDEIIDWAGGSLNESSDFMEGCRVWNHFVGGITGFVQDGAGL